MFFVKVDSSSFDDIKRRFVKFLRLGKYDVQNSVEAAPYGTDSNPIKGMVAVYSKTSADGKAVIIGYLNKDQLADVGEHRTYSTDSDGALQFYIWQKNDGTCEIGGDDDNMVRYSKLEEAFNELKGDFNNLVTLFNSHLHTNGNMGANTGTPTASGQSSNADISPAKIDEIKTIG
jgi:hypothetical protein